MTKRITPEKAEELSELYEKIGLLLDNHSVINIMNVLTTVIADVLKDQEVIARNQLLTAMLLTARDIWAEEEENKEVLQ